MELTENAKKQRLRLFPAFVIIFAFGCASAPSPQAQIEVTPPHQPPSSQAAVRQEGNLSHPKSSQTAVRQERNPSRQKSSQTTVRQEGNPSHPKSSASDDLQLKLRTTVQQWLGTPHRMGGSSRRGVDCSGFVQHLYKQVFGKSIPRSSSLQVKQGRPVTKNQLVPGDLVFFKPPFKINHVGIYLGNQQFAHASTSKGVTISNLTDPFWLDCYWTSRRYLNL